MSSLVTSSSASVTSSLSVISASQSPSALPGPVTKNTTMIRILAIVISVIVVVLIGVATFVFLRIRRRRRQRGDAGARSGILDSSHSAAQIDPFGAPLAQAPRYKHTPGQDMRVAVRRPDGAWQFAEPFDPFHPAGVSEIDLPPSPSSSSTYLTTKKQLTLAHPKEPEHINLNLTRHRTFEDDLQSDTDAYIPPPPAYADWRGYLDQSKD